MRSSRWFGAWYVLRGGFVILALMGTVTTAEPAQQDEQRLNEAVKSPAPADGQSSDLLSKFRFYGEFGPIFLHRQEIEPSLLIGGVNAPSLGLGWKAGLEARAGVRLREFGAEFRWFNAGHVVDGWSDNAGSHAGPLLVGPTGIPAAIFESGLGVRLSSDFTNVEGNLRWQLHPYFAALAGVRYMSLDDDLGMKFNFRRERWDGGGVVTINMGDVGIASRNKLWGGQLGLDARIPILTSYLTVGGAVKAAYLHNSATNKLSLVQQLGSSIRASDRDGQNSWAIELGMDLRYNIFSRVTFLAGYQALWIQRIAQGTDQWSRFTQITPSSGLFPVGAGSVNTSSLWFHGPRAALVIQLPD